MSSRSRGISMIALGMLLCVVRVGGGEETGKKLGGIQKKIEKQREGLTEVRKEEGSVLRALDVIENKLEKKNSQLRAIKGRLVVIRRELGDKEEELNRLAGSLEKRKELLHRRAKALYKWHRGGSPLMVFMGKGTLGEVMRRKRYLELMLGRDQVLLENLLAEANRHDEVREELSTKRQDLDREKKTVEKLRASISGERKKKRVLLSRLRREKEVWAQVLEELEQAANRLQQVMEKLDHQSGRVSRNESFEGGILVQGRLELPVHGEVVRGFGKTKHPEFPAELFRKGINIRAPLGERVRAVERAGWFLPEIFSATER